MPYYKVLRITDEGYTSLNQTMLWEVDVPYFFEGGELQLCASGFHCWRHPKHALRDAQKNYCLSEEQVVIAVVDVFGQKECLEYNNPYSTMEKLCTNALKVTSIMDVEEMAKVDKLTTSHLERTEIGMYRYKNGLLHNERGPAIKLVDGSIFNFIEGKLHKTDGPAVILSDGTKIWYEDGVFLKKEDPPQVEEDGMEVETNIIKENNQEQVKVNRQISLLEVELDDEKTYTPCPPKSDPPINTKLEKEQTTSSTCTLKKSKCIVS